MKQIKVIVEKHS